MQIITVSAADEVIDQTCEKARVQGVAGSDINRDEMKECWL